MTSSLQRATHTDLSLPQLADRLAIRELIDAYAFCADRRDAEGQMSLFTSDTEFLVYMDSRSAKPSQTIKGRGGLRPVFADLNQYVATTHFNGQSEVEVDGDLGTGVTYCLAHHVKEEGAGRSIMIASIRYLDRFVKREGRWYFEQRKLMVDWVDKRPLKAS